MTAKIKIKDQNIHEVVSVIESDLKGTSKEKFMDGLFKKVDFNKYYTEIEDDEEVEGERRYTNKT